MIPRPRHVFMTADAVGGVWTYALDMALGLSARDVRTTLAVLGPRPSAAQRRAAEAVAGLELIETDLPLDWLAETSEPLDRASDGLRTLAARAGADLIHLNAPALKGEADWGAPVVGVCHSCVATWWDAVRGGPLPDDFAWRTERLAAGYARCDALIAPSLSFAGATAARYAARPAAVLNGRPRRPVRGGPRRPVVLTSGRLWDEGKNLATLDRAAARMRGRVEAAGACVGPNGQSARPRRVEVLGQLDAAALADRLDAAAVFCSVALYEPFGLGVLEAARAGCALVLSDIPTFRELWDGAAVFVSARDEDILAHALDSLLENAEEARRLGALAAKRAGRFTVERMVEGALGVHGRVLAGRALPGEAAA